MTDNGYSFVPGGLAFSASVRAEPGYAIVRARLARPVALGGGGFEAVERWLRDRGRPIQALCGMELRIPGALTPDEFAEFNRGYAARLDAWGLRRDGAMPVARTNVAAEHPRVEVPSLAAFSYTVPDALAAPTWILAGIAEIQPGGHVVAAGDESGAGLKAKWTSILEAVEARMAEIGAEWPQATDSVLYARSALMPVLLAEDLPGFGRLAAARLAVCPADPPVRGCVLEIDVRALAREEVMPPGAA